MATNQKVRGSNPFRRATKKDIRMDVFFCAFILRDSNPERASAAKQKLPVASFVGGVCAGRYRNARHLGGQAGKTRSGCIPSGAPRRNKPNLFRFFLFKKISHSLHCSSFFVKRHAQRTCSIASVLATVLCRYHLFTSAHSAYQKRHPFGCLFCAFVSKGFEP